MFALNRILPVVREIEILKYSANTVSCLQIPPPHSLTNMLRLSTQHAKFDWSSYDSPECHPGQLVYSYPINVSHLNSTFSVCCYSRYLSQCPHLSTILSKYRIQHSLSAVTLGIYLSVLTSPQSSANIGFNILCLLLL